MRGQLFRAASAVTTMNTTAGTTSTRKAKADLFGVIQKWRFLVVSCFCVISILLHLRLFLFNNNNNNVFKLQLNRGVSTVSPIVQETTTDNSTTTTTTTNASSYLRTSTNGFLNSLLLKTARNHSSSQPQEETKRLIVQTTNASWLMKTTTTTTNHSPSGGVEEEELVNKKVNRSTTNVSQEKNEERLVHTKNASSLSAAFVDRTNHFSGEEQLVKKKKTNASSLWEAFMENNTKCFFIEDFCHSANRWFYHPKERSSSSTNSHSEQQQQQRRRMTTPKRQPRLIFETNKRSLFEKTYTKAGYPGTIITDHLPEDKEEDVSFENFNCKYSSITNHMVLYSEFNNMLGEFYDRGLAFLYRQFASSFRFSEPPSFGMGHHHRPTTTTTTKEKKDNDNDDPFVKFEEFLEQTQLYLHLEYPAPKLMDSHHLFTSLFRTHPLLDLTVLLNEPNCHCFQRVAFCGYQVEEKQQEESSNEEEERQPPSKIMQPPSNNKNNNSDTNTTTMQSSDELQHSNNNTTTRTTTTTTTRQNRTTIILNPSPIVGTSSPDTNSGLRNLFRRRLIQNNPFVQRDIEHYRKEVLVEKGVVDVNETTDAAADAAGQAEGWRIVGLTQRTSRRRWVNIHQVLNSAGRRLRKQKIILIQVNVEEQGWNSYTQLIRHAALDGLVGIHGAQLTEAIWMPPGSLVVEFLPYVPKARIMGHWTRTTNGPTPLGRIYTNTDLNHVGLPLDIESAPYCFFRNQTGCWPVDKSEHWDDRDFQVDISKIESVIQSMMNVTSLSSRDGGGAAESLLCKDYLAAAKTDYVLYNVNCRESVEQEVAPRHFYWKKQYSDSR